jgi:cyclohexanecarboxylate-CoA ligase
LTLRATFGQSRDAHYRRGGGPWNSPSLDAAMTTTGPDAIRVVDASDGTRLDGTELEARVCALAGGLRAEGLDHGDVVAWQLPNWHEVVLLYRACWRLGVIAAPVHHQAGERDAEQMLAQVDPKLTLARDDVRGPSARFPAWLDAEPVSETGGRSDDLAVALFTSGSTGAPKAALHTQRGLAHKAICMAAAHGLTTDDATLMPAPLAHISGLLNGVLIPGVVPIPVVLMEKWDPNQALSLIEAERVSFMIGPPTFFVSLMRAETFSPARVASLRLISCGGAGVTPAFVEEASEQFRARVKRTYGSTEAPTITTSFADDPPERGAHTDGRVVGEAELHLEPDGELWLRGPELFAGYADRSQTEAAVTRGWFRTGDLATIDDDGWLTITGRLQDIIIRGGENVGAAEVEAILEAHPAIRHAVVVGYPDDVMGERVCAFVVSDGKFGLDECRSWFVAQGVAPFKTPERVERVDEFPVLAAGKPDRAALAARAAPASTTPSVRAAPDEGQSTL